MECGKRGGREETKREQLLEVSRKVVQRQRYRGGQADVHSYHVTSALDYYDRLVTRCGRKLSGIKPVNERASPKATNNVGRDISHWPSKS